MITTQRAYELRALIEKASKSFDDEIALAAIELFPFWESHADYNVGDRVQHLDILYKCIQAHTSQDNWTPNATPALWARVSIDEFPEWIQPMGSQDAYMIGDKVSHNDIHWISTVDNNVWEPGVYGWDEIE